LSTKAVKLAFSGVLCALSVTVLFLGSLFPLVEYAIPTLSGLCLIPIVIEIDRKYAFLAFAAASATGLIVVPRKEFALLFLLFLGYYPIVKSYVESKFRFIAEWALKLGLFNAGMIAAFFVSINLLSIPKEEFSIGGVYLPWLLLLAGNGAFIIYDLAITRVVMLYIKLLHPFFKRIF
jgi:hypothetical protein